MGRVCAQCKARLTNSKFSRNQMLMGDGVSRCKTCVNPKYHCIILDFDGASRHNPKGPAGCGFVVYNGVNNQWVFSGKKYLGLNVSNNQAEYRGLIHGLIYVRDTYSCNKLIIRGDSEIVIKQLRGIYAVRSPNISNLYEKARNIYQDLERKSVVEFQHIDRSRNTIADKLANDAIDHHF